MGRQLRRVALDFDLPIGDIYPGFLMPDSLRPPACTVCHDGDGYSPEGRELKNRWYGYVAFDPASTGSTAFTPDTPEVRAFAERNVLNAPDFYGRGEIAIRLEGQRLCGLWNAQWSHHLSQEDVDALIEAGRLHDLTHDFIPGEGWVRKDPVPVVTAAQVNAWSLRGMGHDSINQSVVARAAAERLGVSTTCPKCKGEGVIHASPEAQDAYENWEPSEPPAGEGYQMWENTSEGSPISPVFASPETLATWLAETNASAFGGDGASYEHWMKMICGSGWAPSAIMVGGQLKSGVEALNEDEDEGEATAI